MLSAVKKLGEYIEKLDLEELEQYQEEDKIEKYVFEIVFDNNFKFYDVDMSHFNNRKVDSYLYDERFQRGPYRNPIVPISLKRDKVKKDKNSKDISLEVLEAVIRAFEKKIVPWFLDCQKNYQKQKNTVKDNMFSDKEIENIINKIVEQFSNEHLRQLIVQKLTDLLKNYYSKNSKFFLTCSFLKGDSIKSGKLYLGDFHFFRLLATEYKIEKLNSEEGFRKGICSICKRERNDLLGKSNVFSFSTPDQPGFTYNFSQINFWKNFPICLECNDIAIKGRNFIEKYLSFDFYGLKYYLIPKTFINDEEIFYEILSFLKKENAVLSKSFNKLKVYQITNDRREILDLLSELDDVLFLNFLFLKKDKSAEKILLLIEDVYPSWLKEIFDAKKRVDEKLKTDFRLGIFQEFLKQKKSNTDFLNVVQAIFTNKKVDYQYFLARVMQKVKEKFIEIFLKEKRMFCSGSKHLVLVMNNALLCLYFLKELKLINWEEGEMERMDDNIFNGLFEGRYRIMNSPIKRGLFLLGVLLGEFLKKQEEFRGSTPFMKKLKSFRLTEKDVTKLVLDLSVTLKDKYKFFKDFFDKPQFYFAFKMRAEMLLDKIYEYLSTTESNWKLSIDEINFCIASGLFEHRELFSRIPLPVSKDKNKEKEDESKSKQKENKTKAVELLFNF